MRIGLGITVVAIALIAAGSVHGDSSGLADRAARSAHPRQLTQMPEPSPPPTGQPRPESPPPSAARAPPAAAPPPNPSPGTPAIVRDDQEVSTILGKSVRRTADEDMVRIVDIIVSHARQGHAAIIDFRGFLGIGPRHIAVGRRPR